MKELSIEEIKKYRLEILCETDKICRENNIKYSLVSGTLIGAVRHGGYIPWDDDIDIGLIAEEYYKLTELLKTDKYKIKLLSNETNSDYPITADKIYMENTIYEWDDKNKKTFDIGLYIDLYRFEYISDDYEIAKKKINKNKFWKDISYNKLFKHYKRTNSLLRCPFSVFKFILSKLYSTKYILYKNLKIFTNKKSKYMASVWGAYGINEIMLSEYFNKYIDIDFEGHSLMCIKDYDKFLKQLYNNYMKLPPKDQQVTHHAFKVYYKD